MLPDELLSLMGKRFGKYEAQVRDINDPMKLCRVKVICPELYGTDLSPWVDMCYTGVIEIPAYGSAVYIECLEGNPARPIYVGRRFSKSTKNIIASDGSYVEDTERTTNNNPVPLHVQGIQDGTDNESLFRGLDVPDRVFKGKYGNVSGYYLQGGARIEFDTTEGEERMSLVGPNGSAIEFTSDSVNFIFNGKRLNINAEQVNQISEKSGVSSIPGGDLEVLSDLEVFAQGITVDSNYVVSTSDRVLLDTGALQVRSDSLKVTTGDTSVVATGLVALGADDVFVNSVRGFQLLASNLGGAPTDTTVSLQSLNGAAEVSSSVLGLQKYGIKASSLGVPPNVTGIGSKVQIGKIAETPLEGDPVVVTTPVILMLTDILSSIAVLTAQVTAVSAAAAGNPVTAGMAAPIATISAALVDLTTRITSAMAPTPTSRSGLSSSTVYVVD